MNKWIAAAIALSAGLVLGSIVSQVVRKFLENSKRPETVREVASPIAGLVFATIFVTGLLTALGFANPESLDTLPAGLIEFIPKAMSAAILVIVSSVGGSLGATAVARSMRTVGGAAARIVPTVVRMAILTAGSILAAGQLGVNTTIINLAAAALLFGIAGAGALLIGLGGREVAGEIAAGRAHRSLLAPGDRLNLEDMSGTVIALHPTSIELEVDLTRSRVHIPHSELLSTRFERIAAIAPTEN